MICSGKILTKIHLNYTGVAATVAVYDWILVFGDGAFPSWSGESIAPLIRSLAGW
jgi:hypothetical protein